MRLTLKAFGRVGLTGEQLLLTTLAHMNLKV